MNAMTNELRQIEVPEHIDAMDALVERLKHLEAKGRITGQERAALAQKLQSAKGKRPVKPPKPTKP